MPKTRRRMDAQKEEEGVMAAINLSEASSAPQVFIRFNPYCEYIFMREQPIHPKSEHIGGDLLWSTEILAEKVRI